MQTVFPIIDGEIKVQESKAGVVSHMDVSLHTFRSQLSALEWTQQAETQKHWQLTLESRLDPVPLLGLHCFSTVLWGTAGESGMSVPPRQGTAWG